MKLDTDALTNFLDEHITQSELDKMQPYYWERTWYRRLWVRIKWHFIWKRSRNRCRHLANEQLRWTPEQWTAWINDGEWPEV